MNSTDILNLARAELRDTETPYLISDEAMYSYIDDAQKMFCRLTEGIEDSRTPEHTRLSVVPGEEWYATSPLMLKLREVVRTDTGRPVTVISTESASKHGVLFDGRTGPVKFLVAGLQRHYLRAWPVPNETVTLEARIFRLPLEPITDAGDQELEIDPQHHRHILHWVKHLVYDNHDTEMFDKRKSAEYQAKFEAYCFRALREQERARRPVGTTLYGGL